jgi:hypothetical protein
MIAEITKRAPPLKNGIFDQHPASNHFGLSIIPVLNLVKAGFPLSYNKF